MFACDCAAWALKLNMWHSMCQELQQLTLQTHNTTLETMTKKREDLFKKHTDKQEKTWDLGAPIVTALVINTLARPQDNMHGLEAVWASSSVRFSFAQTRRQVCKFRPEELWCRFLANERVP